MAIVSPVNYRRPVIARAVAALPAAGAWDAAPLELQVSWGVNVTMYFTYTEGGAGGAFRWRIEVCPDEPAVTWYRSSIYEAGVVAPGGADVVSLVQREEFEYDTTVLAATESFVYGPVQISDGARYLRIPAAEVGNVGAPGTLAIDVMLGGATS